MTVVRHQTIFNAMFEEIPSHAFYGLTVHTDETHAEVLSQAVGSM